MTENGDFDFGVPADGNYNFRCDDEIHLYIDKDSIQVDNLFVIDSQLVKNIRVREKATVSWTVQNLQFNNDIIATKFFCSNATSKSSKQFQTNLRQSQLCYYNLDVEKYYKPVKIWTEKIIKF